MIAMYSSIALPSVSTNLLAFACSHATPYSLVLVVLERILKTHSSDRAGLAGFLGKPDLVHLTDG
jgi:hypothetical protein